MNLTKKIRCGECGNKELVMQNIKNKWGMPWKDFPWVIMLIDFELPVCPKCNNTVIPGEDLHKLNDALKASILKNTSDLLNDLKNKSNLTLKEIGRLTGVTPQYMSMLLNQKKVPSYQFVQLIYILNTHPEILKEMIQDWNLQKIS